MPNRSSGDLHIPQCPNGNSTDAPNGAQMPAESVWESLAALRNGWDRYSAPNPSPAAIENAKALLEVTKNAGVVPERIEPSAMGGVGITFTSGSCEVVVEFYNQGTAHALFSDDESGEMHTQPISTTADGYCGAMSEIREFLYVEQPAA